MLEPVQIYSPNQYNPQNVVAQFKCSRIQWVERHGDDLKSEV